VPNLFGKMEGYLMTVPKRSAYKCWVLPCGAWIWGPEEVEAED